LGLTHSLARYAVRHTHVMVVEVPGHWLTRAAVERHILDRGWRLAPSPGDADVLAVCGTPRAQLAAVVTRLWDQMPGPRARVGIAAPHLVEAALSGAEDELLDVARQQADSRSRPDAPQSPDHDMGAAMNHGAEDGMSHSDHDAHAGHGGMTDEHGGMDRGGMQHAGHGGMDHAGHGGMNHGGMDMAPAGIPLARGGEDRDGLEMDVLHLRLGPALPCWPAGLVLRCSLQGDVIVDAEASLIDPAEHRSGYDAGQADALHQAARRCDNAAYLLALAGWEDGASRARRIRDSLLLDADLAGMTEDLDRLRRAVKRSWVLRWSLRRLRPLTDDDLTRQGLPSHLRGDTRDRLLSMLARAAADLAGSAVRVDRPRPVPLGSIADLVCGLDLGAARLVVASLDLEPFTATSEVVHA
jgi:hypothetical protein